MNALLSTLAVTLLAQSALAEQCIIKVTPYERIENHHYVLFPRNHEFVVKCFDNGQCGLDISGFNVVNKGYLEEVGHRKPD